MAYAHEEVLVNIPWVLENLKTPGIKIIEVDVDPKQYAAGHIPGAIGLDWGKDLQDPVQRNIPTKEQLETLLGSRGVSEKDTIILYGDSSNWFAAYAFWVLKLYGHANVKLLNGGRSKWLANDALPFTNEVPAYAPVKYTAKNPDNSIRARVGEVLEFSHTLKSGSVKLNLVDVRSPDEFTGKVIAPPGMTETAQRGGHIPGATSIPWATAVKEDGEFKSAEDLRKIYFQDKGLTPNADSVAYCRIGERSSHTWFVLKYLLGVQNVKNYDGSWTEYGSMIGVPIEK
jgi:thiosulfate/3-mercaptopyruvate sulfurtransferase